MQIKKLLLKSLLNVPAFIKHPILRSLLNFPVEVPSTLRFKVAETKSELEQAFKLLHDAYVGEQLMKPHASGLRVTKYHALPSTTTLIALENDEVVGTVTLIRQSSFGIPLESIFEVGDVKPDSRLAEVSSLAIKKDRQSQQGRILLPLLKFLYHYSTEYFGVTHFVIAVNPKWIDFYTSILHFKLLSQKTVQNYNFVNGAPAVGGILDLTTLPGVYFKCYGKKSSKKNLYNFFCHLEPKNMEFPLRKKGVISDPVLTPELIQHFFTERTECLSTLVDFELIHLRQLYNRKEYLKVLPSPKVMPIKKGRKEKRFETNLQARMFDENQNSIPVRVLVRDVCAQGICGFMNSSQMKSGEVSLLINLEENEPCLIKGNIQWQNARGYFGLEITQAGPQWQSFIQNLDERLMNPAMQTASMQTASTQQNQSKKVAS